MNCYKVFLDDNHVRGVLFILGEAKSPLLDLCQVSHTKQMRESPRRAHHLGFKSEIYGIDEWKKCWDQAKDV
jgi:hypothetical protein